MHVQVRYSYRPFITLRLLRFQVRKAGIAEQTVDKVAEYTPRHQHLHTAPSPGSWSHLLGCVRC